MNASSHSDCEKELMIVPMLLSYNKQLDYWIMGHDNIPSDFIYIQSFFAATADFLSQLSFPFPFPRAMMTSRFHSICLIWLLLLQSVFCQFYYPNQTNVGSTFPLLIDATTEELETGLEQGFFTSVDLVNAYIARINEVNSTLNVVTELNPDALAIAAELDAERAGGTTRGPLHGMPILIKNNIGTADKMSTTAGSFALLGATLPRDSGIAAKLRAAGVVILGKTNLSQWANFRSTNSTK